MGCMETMVRDLMTSPAVTCAANDTLAEAARAMQQADTGCDLDFLTGASGHQVGRDSH